MYKKLLLVFFVSIGISSMAQVRPGELRGVVYDKSTGETLPMANIVVATDGITVTGSATDFDGEFSIKPLSPGRYDVTASFQGYADLKIKDLLISPDKITTQDFYLSFESEVITEVEVIEYVVPLIDPDKRGKTTTQEEIVNLPQRDVSTIASTTAGVYQEDDGDDVKIRGSRDGADVYIDGVKVRGSSQLPQAGIDQLTVITGGVPAQFGDATSGIISITTRGPSPKRYGGFEYLTSALFDKYNTHLLGFNMSGPIILDKITGLPKLGYFVALELEEALDDDPSGIGVWKIKDDVLSALEADPLRPAAIGTGTVRNADFLTLDDLEHVDAKQNASRTNIRGNAKIDFKPSQNTNITLGGSYAYSNQHEYIYEYSLLNSQNNPQEINNSWRAFARFQQNFPGSENSKISNAFYSLQVDYSKVNEITQDDTHLDKVFNYGHIGYFNTQKSPSYGYGVEQNTGYAGYIQNAFVDEVVYFTPGSYNETGAAFTSDYYATMGDEIEGNYENIFQVQAGGGLLNGDRPQNIYSLWYNTGRQYNFYGNNADATQFRVTASGSADIGEGKKKHSLIFGLEYEQRSDRYWGINPIGLWTLMYQLSNSHILELDLDNPQPVFINGVYQDTINFNRLIDLSSQTNFDRSLRESLGLDPNGSDWLDIHNYNPETFNLDMFSADELLNDGNSYVAYYGYDHIGNRLTSKPSFADFFTETDEYGNATRPIGAFEPIYVSGYLQDKFAFRDLVFNVGVRVDRYDANQNVLKDPYVLFPVRTVGEVSELNGIPIEHPSSVDNDYVVYVDDLQNPTTVLGYRDGDEWFNSNGISISDPGIVADASNTGKITPYLVDADNTNAQTDLTIESFEDYQPQVSIMPRISFNFPISDEAMFFAHYDILTQRPPSYNRMDPTDYLYIQSQGGLLNNPNLLPEKTIDYEIGFTQTLSKRSAVTLSAFYREQRDMIQVVPVNYAYPVTYNTFGNIDFGTIKGFSATYDMRRTGNISMNINYTIQFADGSGSSSTSGYNLINWGQPNLRTILPLDFDQRHTLVATVDYRFGSGTNYDGPIIKNTRLFENTGLNLVFRAGSGTPYSKQSNVTQDAAFGISSRPILDGSMNGSRLPWQFKVDARLDRKINLTWGKGENKRKLNMTVYIQAQNLLNTQNIINVYGYTGNPDDDGFLASAEGQDILVAQTNPESFMQLYQIAVNNPNNYSLPRRMKLGVTIDF